MMNAYDVLDFLKVNENKKYKSYQIAKVFNVSTATMTMTLNALQVQIESEINGKTRDWWFMSDEVRKQKQDRQNEYQSKILRTKRVLKMDQRMSDAMARCRADRGGEYHPITVS